jgi:hypothetical protein
MTRKRKKEKEININLDTPISSDSEKFQNEEIKINLIDEEVKWKKTKATEKKREKMKNEKMKGKTPRKTKNSNNPNPKNNENQLFENDENVNTNDKESFLPDKLSPVETKSAKKKKTDNRIKVKNPLDFDFDFDTKFFNFSKYKNNFGMSNPFNIKSPYNDLIIGRQSLNIQNNFLQEAIDKFKITTITRPELLDTLVELSSQLMMAHDHIANDPNCSIILKSIISLLDKYNDENIKCNNLSFNCSELHKMH